jgi:hypothetical protein
MGWSACFRKCPRCLGSRGGDADGWSASASTLCIPLQPHSSKALPRFSGDVYTCVVGAKSWQLTPPFSVEYRRCFCTPSGDILVDFHVSLDIFVRNRLASPPCPHPPHALFCVVFSNHRSCTRLIENRLARALQKSKGSEEDRHCLAHISVAGVVLSSPSCRFEESV